MNNEITEDFDSGGRGAAIFSWSGDPLVFAGPATFSGNSGSVSAAKKKADPTESLTGPTETEPQSKIEIETDVDVDVEFEFKMDTKLNASIISVVGF